MFDIHNTALNISNDSSKFLEDGAVNKTEKILSISQLHA